VSDTLETQRSLPVAAALCVDREAFERFGRVLRHLLVGLVDQAITLRLLSSDPRIETLTLGPVQTVVHPRLAWPTAGRRIERLLDVVSHPPPTVVHAMSKASYRVAGAVAAALDTDLVLGVTSLADCDAIADLEKSRVGRFVAFSRPLQKVLEEQWKVPPDRIDLIRPGTRVSQHLACFADSQRVVTLLCLSPLERGSGTDRLVEAVHVLRHRGHSLMLFLLGRGRQEAALRRLIRERRLSACVTLAYPAGDCAQALHSADIFVCPAGERTFSEDILQAMAAGTAVVTAPDPIADYLRPNETAVICEKPKAESLASAIEQLLSDREQARRIATAGREHVRAHHAVSTMAERIAGAYRKLALARATFPLKE
jgi:glycosyltransferase involved in cell wall biosynthesis